MGQHELFDWPLIAKGFEMFRLKKLRLEIYDSELLTENFQWKLLVNISKGNFLNFRKFFSEPFQSLKSSHKPPGSVEKCQWKCSKKIRDKFTVMIKTSGDLFAIRGLQNFKFNSAIMKFISFVRFLANEGERQKEKWRERRQGRRDRRTEGKTKEKQELVTGNWRCKHLRWYQSISSEMHFKDHSSHYQCLSYHRQVGGSRDRSILSILSLWKQ